MAAHFNMGLIASVLVGLTFLNRTLLFSYIYKSSPTLFIPQSFTFTAVELATSSLISWVTCRDNHQLSKFNLLRHAVILAISLFTSHLLFTAAPPPVSISVLILSIAISLVFIRTPSIHKGSLFSLLLLVSCAGVLGMVMIYTPVYISSSSVSILVMACFLPSIVFRSICLTSLLHWRTLAFAAALNVFAFLFTSKIYPLPSTLMNVGLLGVNAAIATLSLHILSLENHKYLTVPFLLTASLISLITNGLPYDAWAIHPISTNISLIFIVVSNFATVLILLGRKSLFFHGSPIIGSDYARVRETSYSIPMFNYYSKQPHLNVGLSNRIQLLSPHKFPASITAIAISILAFIITQVLYIPNAPGIDPCSNILFNEQYLQPSPNTSVLITGGAGFIGSNLAEMLLDLGYQVRVLDNLVTGSFGNIAHLQENSNFEFKLGDISNAQDLEDAIDGIEYVYHLAAMPVPSHILNNPMEVKYRTDINAGGSFSVLDTSRQHRVKKVIFAASATVYGVNTMAMQEDSNPMLITPYASSKYEAEIQMDSFDSVFNLNTVSVRLFMVYGTRQPSTGDYALTTGVFMDNLSDNASLPIYGNNHQFQDYIHVSDACESLILAQQSNLHQTVINIGTGIGRSVQQVADLISSDQVVITSPQPHNQVGALADTCRAKTQLGFQAKRDFNLELSSLVDYTKHPERVLKTPAFQRVLQKLMSAPWLLPTKSLVHLYVSHTNILHQAVQAASEYPDIIRSKSDRDQKRLVLLPFSINVQVLVENTYHTLVEHGKVQNILLIAAQSADTQACLKLNVACYNANGVPLSTIVSYLLKIGWTLHVAEPGTAYLRSVWPTVSDLLNQTGASMLVPDNANKGSALRMFTATPAAALLFHSLGAANKDLYDNVYKNVTSLCHTQNECKSISMTKNKIAVTAFTAPYTCLHPKSYHIPSPNTFCSPKWAGVFYMDAACVRGQPWYVVNALNRNNAWFMVPNPCSNMSKQCQRVPYSILNRPDPWSEASACLGQKALLVASQSNKSRPVSNINRIPVLVLGGAGYIGSHLIRTLMNDSKDASYHVTVLDNLSTAGIATIAGLMHRKDDFSFVYGSVNNSTLLSHVLESTGATHIVHLGMPKPEGCGEQCSKDILSGTQLLIESISSAVQNGHIDGYPRLVFCSSSDVYGLPQEMSGIPTNKIIKESVQQLPTTPFASGLLNAENLVMNWSLEHGISSVVLRIFPVYGPTSIPSPLEALHLHWSTAGINFDTKTLIAHDWVHVKDVVQAIVLSLLIPIRTLVGVLNVGSGELKTISSPEKIVNVSMDGTETVRSGYVANLENTSQVLGYAPKLSLEPLAPEPSPQSHPEYQSTWEALKSVPWLLPPGFLRKEMISLANDLTAIAAYASQNTTKLSIVPYQKKYRLMAENVLHSIIQYGNTSNVMLFAMDNDTADDCLWWNFPCFNASSLSVADFNQENKYTNYLWAAISWVKPRVVSRLLDLGYSVHLTDTDIGYVRDVWSSYELYMDEVGADISIAFEYTRFVANTGNYIVRPTAQAKDFYKLYNEVGNKDPTISDQEAFAILYRQLGMQYCQTQIECDQAHTNGLMSIRDYSGFFNRWYLCPHDIDVCKPDLIYIHPICFKTVDDKLQLLKYYGAWYMSEQKVEYYCSLRSTVHSDICIGVPKALLQGVPISEYTDIAWCSQTTAKLTAAVDN